MAEETQYWDKYESYDSEEFVIPEADELNHTQYDREIEERVQQSRFQNAQVALPRGDVIEYGTVKGLKRDAEGKNIGSYKQKPLMDSTMYEVELRSGD